MTKKRFTMAYGKYHDNLNDKEYDEKLESWKICELLNELHEETQRLQNRIKDLELLNDGLNYALKYIRQIDVEIDIDS